jgi:ribosome biogenesis GTPase / thiamine phosphate phosphatase
VLEKIGLDADVSRAAARWAAGDAVLGRVVCVHRGLVSVLTDSGPRRVTFGGGLLNRVAKDPTEAPCTGDWCMVREWPDGRDTVELLLPRRTAVLRAAAGRQSHGQVLCANVDIAALVVALHPLPVLSKVERLVALAWESGARPLVVLTKADLVSDADQVAEDVAAAAPDVDVVTVSASSGDGVAALRSRLEGRLTLGLLGASGHGKSSLLNALAGSELLATRPIREDGRGRHTSVRRELVPLPGGGAVIDTPGLRGVGLLAAADGLALTFRDVDALAARCRFGDCAHDGEPGCRVARAIADGDLSLRRFESWRHLQRELAWAATRVEDRVRIERARAGKRQARRTGPTGG